MNTFYSGKLYEDLKNMKDCLYVDLDSESSDKMLYNCSNAISKKINSSLEKKDVVEGFTSNCCPDGTTKLDDNCLRVCNNCNYNDCNHGSSNLGQFFYKFKVDKKEMNNLEVDEQIFNYIVLDVPSN